MEIKDITTKNLVNKFNTFDLDFEDDEMPVYLNIYTAS